MLGFKFIKVQPTDYVLQYRNEQLVREGAGLSFFYFAPTTSLVRIPMASADAPFIFQEVTVQGQLTCRAEMSSQSLTRDKFVKCGSRPATAAN